MRILLVKTSSLGDIVHLLPALSDAQQAYADIEFDWVVERSYLALPSMHPAVVRVLPVALRQWRSRLTNRTTWSEMRCAVGELRRQQYDFVIDAQGLHKSALLSTLIRGPVWGYDYTSAREATATMFYQRRVRVSKDLHAIARCRKLLSSVLQYPTPETSPCYGISHNSEAQGLNKDYGKYVLGLHGTSRISKEWSETNWQDLGRYLSNKGLRLLLPWGSERERLRAEAISKNGCAQVLPALDYPQLAHVIRGAQAVVGVDTGLLHLAAALQKPLIALYPSTLPRLTGAIADVNSIYPVINLSGRELLSLASVLSTLESLLKEIGVS